MEKSVKRLSINTLIVTIGKISTQFISFLLLPLYTSRLNSEQYGVVDLVQTLCTLLLPILSLQLEQAVFRYLTVSKEIEDKSRIISTAFFGMILQTIIYVFISCILCIFIKSPYKYFLIFNVVTQTWSGFLLQIPRSFGNYTIYSLASIVTGISSIILNVILIVYIPLGAYGMLLATCMGNFLGCIILSYSIKLSTYINIKKISKTLYKEFLKYSIPMIPSHLSWWIINASDRILITFFLGINFNGLYAAAVKLPSVFNIATGILNVTWTETLVSSADNSAKMKENIILFKKIIKLIFCCGILMLAVLPIGFKVLINKKFYAAYNLVPILVLGVVAGSIATLSASFYIVKKNTKNIAKTSLYSAFVNIIIHLLLVKQIGIYAAATSTAVSQIVLVLLRLKGIKDIVKWDLELKSIIVTMMTIYIEVICFYNSNLMTIILGVVVGFIYLVICNKNLIEILRKKNNSL
ncbi:hypothetical protein TPELB_10210 [Terrisporobacter petrolearius]|uniref:Membrane protein involved in the export of O-antigen and teichoic acid n=1 Tax=Terrisporobacter petrolearius TaxID=1460447 RepID=A0ABZ3FC10_9FIRM